MAPKDKRKREKYYSGKKKRDTIKTQIFVLKCKGFKILKQIYRHPLKSYHQRFQVIAGIINFQLRNKENLIPIPLSIQEIAFSKV